jgi:hypothetical protein
MRILCPHCGQPVKIRTSREVTPSTREAYVHCENPECGSVFHVLISVTGVVKKSDALPHIQTFTATVSP